MTELLSPEVIKLLQSSGETEIIYRDEDDGVHIASMPKDRRLESLESFIPRAYPRRARGFTHLETLDSLVSWTNRFKREGQSVIFVNAAEARTIITYHVPETDVEAFQPEFCDFGAVSPNVLSEQYAAWLSACGDWMGQAEFAEFLEAHINDIAAPPVAADEAYASASTLLALSTSLDIKVSQNVREARRLSSGEVQLHYEETHTDSSGGPVRVPKKFFIGVPVYSGRPARHIEVHLRYKVQKPKVVWALSILDQDRILRESIGEIVSICREQTLLPVYEGTHKTA